MLVFRLINTHYWDLNTFCLYMMSFSLGKCNIGVFKKLLIRRMGYHWKGVVMLDVQDIDCHFLSCLKKSELNS